MSNQSQLDSSQTGETRFWSIAWRISLACFIGLLAACAYRIVDQGFPDAVWDMRFQWLAVVAIITGILVLTRYTIRLFTRGFMLDRCNMTLRGRAYGNWFVPRQNDTKR